MTSPRRIESPLTSDTAQLADARRAVEAFASGAGFNAEATGQVGLCVNEAIANVIRHAYHGATGRPIHLTVEAGEERGAVVLRVSLRDWGNGKTPTGRPPRPPGALEPGGVGMICLKQLMDEVVYSPQPDGMLLTMTKRQPAGDP